MSVAVTETEILRTVYETLDKLKLSQYSDKVRLEWNDRFTSRMGDAHWNINRGAGQIRLSTPLWPLAPEAQRKETVVHEVCHVAATILYGRRQGHKSTWRHLMKMVGYPNAKRCHAINDLKRRHEAKFVCGCGDHKVGPTVGRRILSGESSYKCRHCRKQITPVGVTVPDVQPIVVQRRRHGSTFVCGCGDRQVGPVVGRRILTGESNYTCSKCRKRIVPRLGL